MSKSTHLYIHCWRCLRSGTTGSYRSYPGELYRFNWTLFGLTYYTRSGATKVLHTRCDTCG